jgi:anaerobic magnesium-protoporphyrin IX monomethyl ester cyclase
MPKPKVLFVRPPNLQKSGQWKKQGVIRCPLNICLLASFVRERGEFDCSVADFEIMSADTPEQMARMILEFSPKYVCFTTLTPRFPVVVKTAQEIKKINPDVVCIAGGPHVTGVPEAALQDGITYGIVGEGEEALLELLNALENKSPVAAVKNLAYRYKSQVKLNSVRPFYGNLDDLPFPAWDLMQLEEYKDPAYFQGSHLAIFSGRGCPYDCKFCASAVTWKRKLRVRSVENVIKEIRHITGVLRVKNLMFWDDTFAADIKRAISICQEIKKEKIEINYTVQLRADAVSDELVYELKSSGCSFAAIGVESGNEEMLKSIGKRETKNDFRSALKIMKEGRLACIGSYILGLPGDTHETIRQTIDFAFELNAEQSKFMILSPYPGTCYYDLALKKGLVDPYDFGQLEALNYYDSVAVNLSNVSDNDLLRYQDEAYARFDKTKEGI